MARENSDPLGVARPKTPQPTIDEPDSDTRLGHAKEQQEISTPSTPVPNQIGELLAEDAMTEFTRSSDRKRRRLDKYRDAHRGLKGKLSHAAVQLLSGMESPKPALPPSPLEQDQYCAPVKKARHRNEPHVGPGLICAGTGCPICTTGEENQRHLEASFDGSPEDASRDAALKAAGYCPACDGQDPFVSQGTQTPTIPDGHEPPVTEEQTLTSKCCSLCEIDTGIVGKGKGKEISRSAAEEPSIRADLDAACCTVETTECPPEHEQQAVECCQLGEMGNSGLGTPAGEDQDVAKCCEDGSVSAAPACDHPVVAECCQDPDATVVISSETTTGAIRREAPGSPDTPICCEFPGTDRPQQSETIEEGPEAAAVSPNEESNSFLDRPVPGAFPFECGDPAQHEESSSVTEDIDSFPAVPLFSRDPSKQKVQTIYGQLEKTSVEQVKDWATASLKSPIEKKIPRACNQPDEKVQAVIVKGKPPTNRKVASSSRTPLIPPRSKSGRRSSGFIAHDIPWKDERVSRDAKGQPESKEQAGSTMTAPKVSPPERALDHPAESETLQVPPPNRSPLRRKDHLKTREKDENPTGEKWPTPYFNAWKSETSLQGSKKEPQALETVIPVALASGAIVSKPGPIPNIADDSLTRAGQALSSSSSDEIPLQFISPKHLSRAEALPQATQAPIAPPQMTKAELKAHQKATKALEKLAHKEAKKKEKIEKEVKKRGGNFDGPGSGTEFERSASPSPSEQRDSPSEEVDSAGIVKSGEAQKQDSGGRDPPRPDSSAADPHFVEDLERIGDRLQSERPVLTEEDNERIRKKTDKVILAILVWVYFLQILDKSVLGYGSIFGLQNDNHLVGDQYSLVGSIAPIAQLAWQPFSSILIVKVPHRILMPSLVLGWGIAQTAMAACHSYAGLLTTRFFLGLFEAGCLPLFGVITNQWYRRSEQPIRVAAWYGTNGAATIVASALSYGLGHIPSQILRSWQIIFLFVGLVTIVSAPFVYWKLDNDVTSARFLTEHEKIQAVERLRVNQTGIGSRKFEWSHVKEVALEPKTYLWIGMSLLVNVGASVTNTFGPLILSGFGFDKYKTSLLNIPFGFVQLVIILFSSYAAQKWKLKSAVLLLLVFPVIAGLIVLYIVPRGETAPLLVGYYLLAFLFGSNPLIVSWIIGNTAGTTKKSVIMSLYNAGSSAGNIIGPLLFSSKDAPSYFHGLKSVLAIFATLAVVVVFQAGVLFVLNQGKERERVRNGKSRLLRDPSMEERWESIGDPRSGLGEHAFDRTDGVNDEFVYIY